MGLEERLDNYPTPWLPKGGDRMVGRVVEVGERESRYGGTYPVVVIVTDDGEEVVVHAYHAVLKSELAQQRPRPGDRIGLKYFGRDEERGYERYRVIVERAPEGGAGPDWDRFGAEAQAELAEPDATTDVAMATGPVLPHRFAGDADGIDCTACGWAREHPVHREAG